MTTPKRYTALRVIATLLKILAWITLILSIVGAIAVGTGGMLNTNQILGEPLSRSPLASMVAGLGGALLSLLFGVLYFIAFYAAGQSINLQIDVEHNTRETHELLRQILRAQTLPPPDPNQAVTQPYRPVLPTQE